MSHGLYQVWVELFRGRECTTFGFILVHFLYQKGKGPGYERWAKVHNIKQMAQTLLFLEEHNLRDYDELAAKAKSVSDRFAEITERQKSLEARLTEITDLKKHIINYSKTKQIYVAYRESGYADDFVCCFQYKREAEIFYEHLKSRMKYFGLYLEETKTRLIYFGRFAEQNLAKNGKKPETFDFLGFTHYCAKSRNGNFRVKHKTASKKFRKKCKQMNTAIRDMRFEKKKYIITKVNQILTRYYHYYEFIKMTAYDARAKIPETVIDNFVDRVVFDHGDFIWYLNPSFGNEVYSQSTSDWKKTTVNRFK